MIRHLLPPLVLRPAAKDRLRFALTVSGIAVGVATMAAIRLANASVLSSFSDTVDFVAGKASITILADGPGIPEETLERLAWLRGIGATLAPAITETAATGANDGEIIEVLGIDPLADPSAREYSFAEEGKEKKEKIFLEGEERKEPSPGLFSIFEEKSILVTSTFAARHAVKPGSEFRLVTNSVERTFRVAAVLRPAGAARAASGSIVFMDIAAAQEAFGKVGRLDRIDVVLPASLSDADRARVLEEVSASLPPGVTAGRPERRTETVDRMVRAFRVNLSALGAIALLVGMYFVYNTLSISVLRRRADIGVVRALGASRRSVFAAFLLEGLSLGVLGSVLGLALGAALAAGALKVVGGTATELYVPSAHPVLRLDPGVLAFAFALGVATSVLSALAPAFEAAGVEPAATMRHGSVEAARRRRTRPLALAGAVLLVLAWAATRPGPVLGLPVFGFVSVFLVVAGASLLAPAAVTFAAARADGLALRLFGVEARIARANLTGSLSRTSVAVAALTMGLSMMVAVAVMVGSFRTTVATWVGETLAGDVFVGPASGRSGPSLGRVPEEAIEAIRAVPGVADVDPFLAFSATRDGAPYTVGSGLFAYVAKYGNLPLVDGRDPKRVFAGALANGEAMVSEPYAEKFGVKTGDSVDLPGPSGLVRVRVAGVYTDYSNDRGTVTLDRAHFRRIWPLSGASTMSVVLAPGVSPEEGARRIEQAVRGRFALRVRTNATLRKLVLQIFDRTFAVTYALEAVAIAVAVLGVFNTLTALVLERRREIGLLRVLGASAARVRRAVRYEAAAIGGLGIALGLASGAAMALVLVHVINRQSFGWTIAMHWPLGFLAGALALVFATTLLAAARPAGLAAATDAAAALKEE
ncbi:MAG: FtsX-like permease family protein [Acidobacteria bacterium]|nr:FtsX-like permease family protein [Acidobacteriota bacterium]